MANIRIFLGDSDELKKNQREPLEEKFHKKEITLEYKNSETAPDGRFLSTKRWKTNDLWAAIAAEIGFTPARTPQKIVSTIERPGKYTVEVESRDKIYTGKVSIVHDKKDTSAPAMKVGSHPAKVVLKTGGLNVNLLPSEHKGDLQDLLTIMKKPQSYRWTGEKGSSKGWGLDFEDHEVKDHAGRGWKAYIDVSRGTSTIWRLYFEFGYDVRTGAMMVQANEIFKEH